MNLENSSILEELRNTVTQGDCLEVMKKLPDNCIDLVLTDPPYGIGDKLLKGGKNGKVVDFGKKYGATKWEDIAPTKEIFDELFRISKHQVIFGANYFDLPPTRGIICWDKNIGTPHNFSHWEMAWTSVDCPAKKFIQTNDNNKLHPTQKPLELMVWCLENYLLKKWKEDRRPIVFDGFAGSGTTGVACKKCGCDYILVEKEKDYCEVINKRLAQDTLF